MATFLLRDGLSTNADDDVEDVVKNDAGMLQTNLLLLVLEFISANNFMGKPIILTRTRLKVRKDDSLLTLNTTCGAISHTYKCNL